MVSAIELFQGFKYPIGDTLLYALLGLAVVFAILFVLVFIFIGVGKLLEMQNNKSKTAADKDDNEPVLDIVAPDESEEELVAVITAAIAAQLAAESGGQVSKAPFIIRKVYKMP